MLENITLNCFIIIIYCYYAHRIYEVFKTQKEEMMARKFQTKQRNIQNNNKIKMSLNKCIKLQLQFSQKNY